VRRARFYLLCSPPEARLRQIAGSESIVVSKNMRLLLWHRRSSSRRVCHVPMPRRPLKRSDGRAKNTSCSINLCRHSIGMVTKFRNPRIKPVNGLIPDSISLAALGPLSNDQYNFVSFLKT